MPPVKPGRWSVNPSSIGPNYQSLWKGLVALVPVWGDPTPIELVKRKLATDTTRPKMTPVVDRFGPALRQSQALDTGASWLAGDYDEFSTNPATTLAWVGTRVGVGDATGPHMWGYYVSESVQIRLVSFDDEIFYLEYNDAFIGSVVMPANTPLLGLAFVSNGRQYLRVYNLLTTERIASGSDSSVFTPPAAGGRLVLGSAAALSIGVDHTLAAAWNRELTDAEIQSLLIDPFGMIRPKVESQGAVASLYATATHTIDDVVDEADTTVDLHLSVDDDPSVPNDADWVNNAVAVALGASVFLGLTDLPSDFGNAEAGSIMVRVRGSQVTGTLHLYARLYQSDETTALSDEVEAIAISSDGVFTNYAASFTGLNTSANKTVWDAARVRFRWSSV